MNWYFKVFKQSFDFSTRARRKEYWMFALFNFIVLMLLIYLDVSLGTTSGEGEDEIGWFFLIYFIISLIPNFAVAVRRMHDLGKSGAWVLINMIPLIGGFWFLILTCMEGENKTNKWGPNPKGNNLNNQIDLIGRE